jgi:2'-5' RNA ligase
MERMERRLFIGIPLPEDIAQELHACDPKIEGARWLSPSVYHITLCFIGETEMDPEEEVLCPLREEAEKTPPFSLPFEGPILAPPKRPYMIWAKYGNVPTFQDLHERLIERFVPEKAPPGRAIPHVTLARMKRGKRPKDHMIPKLPELPPLEVDRATLWCSELQRRGAVHHPMGEASLKGGAEAGSLPSS